MGRTVEDASFLHFPVCFFKASVTFIIKISKDSEEPQASSYSSDRVCVGQMEVTE